MKKLIGYLFGGIWKAFSRRTPRSAGHLRFLFLAMACVGGTISAGALPVLETVIFPFTNSAFGGSPKSHLVIGSDGALYGTTCAFGAVPGGSGGGTVFKVNRDGSGFRVLHTFGIPDGDGIMTATAVDVALVVGADNYLYGATSGGGSGSFGTVYKIAQDGSIYQILHNFDSTQQGSVFGSDPGVRRGAIWSRQPGNHLYAEHRWQWFQGVDQHEHRLRRNSVAGGT